jgi:hypothetical protein
MLGKGAASGFIGAPKAGVATSGAASHFAEAGQPVVTGQSAAAAQSSAGSAPAPGGATPK